MVESASVLIEVFQSVVVTSWRATVVALLILAVLWCLRGRLSARSRMLLWSLLVVRLICTWDISSSLSLFNAIDVPAAWYADATNDDAVAAATVRIGNPSPLGQDRRVGEVLADTAVAGTRPDALPWQAWFGAEPAWTLLTGVWLAGAASLLLLTAFAVVRFRRRLARGSLPAADVQALLDECRQILGMQRSVRLVVSDAVATPAVSGLWRPTLLIPPAVICGVDRAQLRLILLHELIHVQRGDVWWNWLMTLLRIVHWFNPALRLAFDRFDRERELVCDQRVLRVVGLHESRRYAQTLLNVLELCQHRLVARSLRPAGITGMADGLTSSHALAERMSHMLEISKKRHTEWKLGLAATLLLATVGLTKGQETPPQPKPETQGAAAPPPAPILSQPILPAEISKEVVDAAAAAEQAKALEGPLLVVSFDMARLLTPRHDAHFERPAFTRDQIEAIVRREAGPKGWDEEQHKLSWDGDEQRQLIVRHTRPILKRIQEAVSYADKYGTSRVLLELQIYNGSAPELAAFLPAAPQSVGDIELVSGSTIDAQPMTHVVLTAEKAAVLQEKLLSAKEVHRLACPKLTSLWGQESSIGIGKQRPFVVAFEKEGNEHKPVIELFDEGIFTKVRCAPRKGGKVLLDLEVQNVEILKVLTATTDHGTVQLPTYSKAMVRTAAEVPNEQFLVLQSPRSKTGKSMQALTVLIRPVIIDGDAAR